MAKTIFKEIFIILLITVAVGLILAIIFYKYMPTNKIIPSKVSAYSTPDEVAKEIAEDTKDELESENKVYTITDADLQMYKAEKSYNPGKVNPFKNAQTQAEENNETEVPSVSAPVQETNRNTTDNYYTAAGVGSGTK